LLLLEVWSGHMSREETMSKVRMWSNILYQTARARLSESMRTPWQKALCSSLVPGKL
ncbi:hypothetical protein T10_6451, partial [Trichinella papuae]